MLVVIPFCSADAADADDLIGWIGQLGGAPQHNCLLVMDHGVEWSDGLAILSNANRVFRSATFAATDAPITGWPDGANALWLVAARYAKAQGTPFLWLEPDAIPLKPAWLEMLQTAYGSGFMGHVYDCQQEGLPSQVLSGVAVYPADAIDIVEPEMGKYPTRAWDIAAADAMLRHTQPTRLIHHFWGQPGLPPTFVEAKSPGTPDNAFTLSKIFPEAVIFHRNKDGTLLNLLRRRYGKPRPGNFMVVLPFCNNDSGLMIRLLEWMELLNAGKTHDCLLSYDQTTMRNDVKQIAGRAGLVFSSVQETSYKVPKHAQFPQTAAWQHAARTMHRIGRPWLWCEADCVPLKRSWLTLLQTEYARGGKPFCGPIMQGPGHMNGTGIYPANTPQYCPRSMSVLSNAWDVEMRDEMISHAHPSKLWSLAWGVVRGYLDPLAGEELPSFPKGSALLNQIRGDAVIFHRCKDGSLIQRLRERLKP